MFCIIIYITCYIIPSWFPLNVTSRYLWENDHHGQHRGQSWTVIAITTWHLSDASHEVKQLIDVFGQLINNAIQQLITMRCSARSRQPDLLRDWAKVRTTVHREDLTRLFRTKTVSTSWNSGRHISTLLLFKRVGSSEGYISFIHLP